MTKKFTLPCVSRRILLIALSAFLLAGCTPAIPTSSPQPSTTASPALPTLSPTAFATIPLAPSETLQPTPLPTQSEDGAKAKIAAILAGIEQRQVEAYLQGLTGKAPLTIGKLDVMIESREDAQNLDEVTQALYEFLRDQGLNASYHEWYDDDNQIGGRNVIGELRGATRPDEIVILCAHIDSTCDERLCPGADDNASGAIAVILAAERLPGMRFERTLRFVFFTGEEIDLLGSWYYAEDLDQRGENVVAVVNVDMIGWDGNGDGVALLYTRTCRRDACPEDQAIAEVLIQAVKTYQITGLYPRITQGDEDSSDSYSFWEAGFPGILAIEDDQREENPYYHSADDTIETLDLAYLTRYIRAIIATGAELAGPLEP